MMLMKGLRCEAGELKLNGELWLDGKSRPCFCNPTVNCNRKTCKTFVGPQKLAGGETGFELCDCNVTIAAGGFVREVQE